MSTLISQRELRNDNADIMRRIENGERFTVTRRGVPVATITAHTESAVELPEQTGAQIQEFWRMLPRADEDAWASQVLETRRRGDGGAS